MMHLPPGAYRRYMRVVGIALWTGIITALVLRVVFGG